MKVRAIAVRFPPAVYTLLITEKRRREDRGDGYVKSSINTIIVEAVNRMVKCDEERKM